MLDELDKRIIQELTNDARQSSKALAEKLNVDSSTVRRRIQHLVKDGIIFITALPTLQKTGYPVKAMIGLEVDTKDLDSDIQIICQMPECKFVSMTTGHYNVFITLWCQSTTEVYSLSQEMISRLKGVKNSEIFVCMNIVKTMNPLDIQQVFNQNEKPAS